MEVSYNATQHAHFKSDSCRSSHTEGQPPYLGLLLAPGRDHDRKTIICETSSGMTGRHATRRNPSYGPPSICGLLSVLIAIHFPSPKRIVFRFSLRLFREALPKTVHLAPEAQQNACHCLRNRSPQTVNNGCLIRIPHSESNA